MSFQNYMFKQILPDSNISINASLLNFNKYARENTTITRILLEDIDSIMNKIFDAMTKQQTDIELIDCHDNTSISYTEFISEYIDFKRNKSAYIVLDHDDVAKLVCKNSNGYNNGELIILLDNIRRSRDTYVLYNSSYLKHMLLHMDKVIDESIELFKLAVREKIITEKRLNKFIKDKDTACKKLIDNYSYCIQLQVDKNHFDILLMNSIELRNDIRYNITHRKEDKDD